MTMVVFSIFDRIDDPSQVSSVNGTLGQRVLEQHGLDYSDYFYWISPGALIGFWMVFNVGFTCALTFSKGN